MERTNRKTQAVAGYQDGAARGRFTMFYDLGKRFGLKDGK